MSYTMGETVGYIGDTQNEYVVICKVGYGWNSKYEITPKSNFCSPGGVKNVSLNILVLNNELHFPCREYYTRDNYLHHCTF